MQRRVTALSKKRLSQRAKSYPKSYPGKRYTDQSQIPRPRRT